MFFSTKKIAVICPEARAGYQRGCLRTAERAAAERRSGAEAPDQAAPLAAGAGGHQWAAQEASRHPAGLPGLPRAGVCQHPRAYEAELSKSHRKGSLLGGMTFWKNSARGRDDLSCMLPPKMFLFFFISSYFITL